MPGASAAICRRPFNWKVTAVGLTACYAAPANENSKPPAKPIWPWPLDNPPTNLRGHPLSVGGKQVSAGLHLAAQRVTVRIDHQLLHVITADGVLARTLPSPLPPSARARLRGARLARPRPAIPPTGATHVSRVVSSQGSLMVAGTKLQVGHAHRRKVVTVVIEDNQFRIVHDGTQLSAHPRTVIKEVTRRSASGHASYQS
jgi:hypothetical protein